MSNPLTSHLEHHSLLILDGALATELERRGCDLHDPLWSAKVLLEKPALIAEVHRDYLFAGADCLITASYQATVAGFMQRGLTPEAARDMLQRSVQLAVEARDTFWQDEANHPGRLRPLVAASIGPYGAFLADGSEYRGDYSLSAAELMDFHRPRLAALLDAGPDLLACETLPSLTEALALARLLTEFP
ncbi:MAG: homocysteine S-methyltransferase, partial [Candidatus Competibacteraceae bacterium]